MLRSLALALCAALFVACATAPPPPADVPVISETPRWVSGELIVNFIADPPEVKLCVGGKCDVRTELMGRIKDGTAALLYPIPDDRALRYDEIRLVPQKQPDGSMRWVVYAVSRDFGNVGCTRWFTAIPTAIMTAEVGEIAPAENLFGVVEAAPEHDEGCDFQIKPPQSEDQWRPDDWKPHEPKE